MSHSVRVLLVDDHPLVLEGILSVLAHADDIDVVATADTIDAARKAIAATKPDVVLIDERLPDGSGIDVVASYGAEDAPRFVLLTLNDHVDCVRRALEVGAAGYLLKDIPGARLREAVHAAARGQMPLDPRLTGVLLEGIRQRRDEQTGLTWRDRQVLSYLADGLTNAQISERMKVAPSTAKGYVTNLCSRLGVATRAAAVGLAARHGLLTMSDSTRPDIRPTSDRSELMVVRR